MSPPWSTIAGVVLALTSAAAAQAPTEQTGIAVQVGGELRTEWGVHPLRIHAGVELERLGATLVADPLFWTTGEASFDLLGTYRLSRSGWTSLLGWRPTALQLDHGTQLQHGLLIGVLGPLPRLGPVALSWGVELCATLVKHRGGLPMDRISFASSSALGDDINLSMFLRVGYASRR